MRTLLGVICVLLLCSSWAGAKDSVSQSKSRLKNFLNAMVALEKEAKPIEPMHISLQKRTRAEDKEMTRRIEFLDELINGKVRSLGKEISSYQSQVDDSLNLSHQAVKDAYEALNNWLNAKLTLQNAGVNNPGLESLKKNEPLSYQEYQNKLKAAQEKLK